MVPSPTNRGSFTRAWSGRCQAVFRGSAIGEVAVANIHVVSGTFVNNKTDGSQAEDHSVPGKSPLAKEAFKIEAVTAAMMAVDNLMEGRGH